MPLPYDDHLLTGCRLLKAAEILPVEPDPTSIGVGMSVKKLLQISKISTLNSYF